MNVQAEKIALAKIVLGVNSETILKHVKAVLESYQSDLWDELSEQQKTSVRLAQIQLKRGEGISHKEAMKKHLKWRMK
jgi:hypothetical protein